MDDSESKALTKFREIPFSNLSLSVKNEKLLKRICNLNTTQTHQISETIGGILDLDPNAFSKMPAIGKSYVDSLVTLKTELLNEAADNLKGNEEMKSLIDIDDKSFKFSVIPSSLSELHLNYQYLKKHDVKLIEKLEKLYGSRFCRFTGKIK